MHWTWRRFVLSAPSIAVSSTTNMSRSPTKEPYLFVHCKYGIFTSPNFKFPPLFPLTEPSIPSSLCNHHVIPTAIIHFFPWSQHTLLGGLIAWWSTTEAWETLWGWEVEEWPVATHFRHSYHLEMHQEQASLHSPLIFCLPSTCRLRWSTESSYTHWFWTPM